ncbi:Tat pathway signal sequence domain protein [Streptomyces sp. NPDC058872]|uniref:Tat pathway signal sequence domain protein n=1 Tax=Streptomyces sp. NPDC058872 TaxID=3346661 RepID=UPI00369413AB
MYEMMRRHLGKVVAGAAMAVTGTAVAVAIALPGPAGADDTPGGDRGAVAVRPPADADTAGAAGTPGANGGSGTGEAGEQVEGAAPRPAVVLPPATGEGRGVGSDPLTAEELTQAEALALTPPATAQRDVTGARGPQRLGTRLADPLPGDGTRRAEVRLYDYARDAFIVRTVNLDTGAVESSVARRGVQPSAHPDELREAVELILASPLAEGLKEDYADATGKKLTSADQLWFNGDVYRTYREADVPAQLVRCGQHRCVRLVTKVLNGPWINTRNLIVDLSTRTVTRVG